MSLSVCPVAKVKRKSERVLRVLSSHSVKCRISLSRRSQQVEGRMRMQTKKEQQQKNQSKFERYFTCYPGQDWAENPICGLRNVCVCLRVCMNWCFYTQDDTLVIFPWNWKDYAIFSFFPFFATNLIDELPFLFFFFFSFCWANLKCCYCKKSFCLFVFHFRTLSYKEMLKWHHLIMWCAKSSVFFLKHEVAVNCQLLFFKLDDLK